MVRAKGMGYRVAEVPISFVDRGEIPAIQHCHSSN